jgi:hypothetical protein
MEELRKLNEQTSKVNYFVDETTNKLIIEKINTAISSFNNSLKGMDSNTVLNNQQFIRQLKYKLKMLRKYALCQKGVKEDDIEPILNKECTIVV